MDRYRMYRSGKSGVYFQFDKQTKSQKSLHTKDHESAVRMIQAANEKERMPMASYTQPVSRVTVRLALGDLENRGLIFRKHGKGTFAHGNSTRVHRRIAVLIKSRESVKSKLVIEIVQGAFTAISTLGSRDHRLVTDLARSAGILPKLIEENGNKLPVIADLSSKAIHNQPLYTVTVAKLSTNGEIKHDHVFNTLNGWEALQRRAELNEKRPFYGSKEVAQVIRREVLPRQWKLWVQVSTDEVHLRCAWTKARALLSTPTSRLMDRLHRGHTLPQSSAVYLQSEKVELTMESISTRPVTFSKPNGPKVTQRVEIRTPIICYLDVNASSELVADTQCGVVSRHPFEQNDKLILPEQFAKALWSEGIILPLEAQIGGKILVQLTDPELRTRLALSRLNLKERGVSALESRPKSSPPPLPLFKKRIGST